MRMRSTQGRDIHDRPTHRRTKESIRPHLPTRRQRCPHKHTLNEKLRRPQPTYQLATPWKTSENALDIQRTQSGRHTTINKSHCNSLCAPGVSGQRGEHAEHIYALRHETLKQRWLRAIDELIIMPMAGTLPECCAWILNATAPWFHEGTDQEADARRR